VNLYQYFGAIRSVFWKVSFQRIISVEPIIGSLWDIQSFIASPGSTFVLAFLKAYFSILHISFKGVSYLYYCDVLCPTKELLLKSFLKKALVQQVIKSETKLFLKKAKLKVSSAFLRCILCFQKSTQ